MVKSVQDRLDKGYLIGSAYLVTPRKTVILARMLRLVTFGEQHRGFLRLGIVSHSDPSVSRSKNSTEEATQL